MSGTEIDQKQRIVEGILIVGLLLDSVTKKSKIKILGEIPLAFPLYSWFSAEKWRKNIFQSIDFRENHSASPEVNFGDMGMD